MTVTSRLRLQFFESLFPSIRSLTRMPVFCSVPYGKMKTWCPPDFLPCKRRDWKDTQHPIKCSTVTVTLRRICSFRILWVICGLFQPSNPCPGHDFYCSIYYINQRQRFLKAGEIWSWMLFECSKRKLHLCYAAATVVFSVSQFVCFYTYNTYF